MAEPLALESAEQAAVPDVLKGLNNGQKRFSELLALYDNPLKAYRLAGYTVLDPPSNTPYVMAGNPKIFAAVQYWKEVFSSHAHTSPEKILVNMSLMANVDATSYFNDDWSLKSNQELTDDQRLALTGVEVIEKGTGRTIKLKFSKLEATKELANIHRMYDDDKSKANGLNLTIQLGQQVNVQTAQSTNPKENNGLVIDLSEG